MRGLRDAGRHKRGAEEGVRDICGGGGRKGEEAEMTCVGGGVREQGMREKVGEMREKVTEGVMDEGQGVRVKGGGMRAER